MTIRQVAWISRFETEKAVVEVEIRVPHDVAYIRIWEDRSPGAAPTAQFETLPEFAMSSMLSDLEGMNLL